MSSQDSRQIKDSDREIEQILITVERSLSELKERYLQVKQDWQARSQLLAEQEQLQQRQQNNVTKEPVKTELKHLQQKLAELELNLESRLLVNFSPFWQVVRFVGLGIVIGWLLKTWAS
jgi:DNA repair exonuclease SbcCD ATPase subunit